MRVYLSEKMQIVLDKIIKYKFVAEIKIFLAIIIMLILPKMTILIERENLF
jgi:hypothetical protein